MRQVKNSIVWILILFFVISPFLMAVPARAVALDPVTFLYPIWQAFGGANGVSVATAGGDQFTQQAFPSLFNEWQTSRVSNGLQETAQSLSDWVDSIKSYVSVAPSAVSMGILNTALRLESNVVMPLTEFWNWIIKDKLGGSSVDAVDFSHVSGNLGMASAPVLPVPYYDGTNPVLDGPSAFLPIYIYSGSTYRFGFVTDSSVDLFAFCYPNPTSSYQNRVTSVVVGSAYITGYSGKAKMFSAPLGFSSPYDANFVDLLCDRSDSVSGLYYHSYNSSHGFELLPNFDSFEAGMAAAAAYISNPSAGGSITVSPEVGIGALDFPDAADPDYVPSDAVIPWNVPYDQAADRDDYLDRAYDKALDNTLQDVDGVADTPVEGTGTVGSVDQYLAPNLADVFPFCIPFDIYNFLSLLAADPEAPSFTCELAFPAAIGGSKEITIDFDTPTWNQLAMILRTFELLLFIVGLAYITREKMIRS